MGRGLWIGERMVKCSLGFWRRGLGRSGNSRSCLGSRLGCPHRQMLSYPEKNFHFEVNGWGGNWGMLDLDEGKNESEGRGLRGQCSPVCGEGSLVIDRQ